MSLIIHFSTLQWLDRPNILITPIRFYYLKTKSDFRLQQKGKKFRAERVRHGLVPMSPSGTNSFELQAYYPNIVAQPMIYLCTPTDENLSNKRYPPVQESRHPPCQGRSLLQIFPNEDQKLLNL